MENNYNEAAAMPVFTIRQIKKMALSRLHGKWSIVLVPMIIILLLTDIPNFAITFFSNDNLAQMGVIGTPSAGIGMLATAFSIYGLITFGAFQVSTAGIFLSVIRNEKIDASSAFTGFKRFGQSFCTYILVMLFTVVWMTLIMLPGIVIFSLAYAFGSVFALFIGVAAMLALAFVATIYVMRYRMSYFLAFDYPTLRASEAVAASCRMMQGRRIDLFLLELSFIGWALIPALFTGICGGLMAVAYGSGGSYMLYFVAFIFAIVAAVCYAFLSIYMNTANAIFYSALSGNFRPAADISGGATPAENSPTLDGVTSTESITLPGGMPVSSDTSMSSDLGADEHPAATDSSAKPADIPSDSSAEPADTHDNGWTSVPTDSSEKPADGTTDEHL